MTQEDVDILHKYGCITEHSEAFFSTPRIYFSPPKKLNDPFECHPWFTFNGNRDEVIDSLTRLFQKTQRLTAHEAKARAVGSYLEMHHKNPQNLEAFRNDIISTLSNKIGLCCLSQVPDSILMWSHYGLDHTGYCVEFEATRHTPVFGEALPVLYSADHPVVDFYQTPKDDQVNLIFLTKYSGWVYEQEWRIIDHENGPGLREYPAELMKSVIFGLRMSNQAKQQIREWVSRRRCPIRFFQAVQHKQRFVIELEQIE